MLANTMRRGTLPTARAARAPATALAGSSRLVAQARRGPPRVAAAALDIDLDSYCCLGVSHCFVKNEEGKLVDRYVAEPIGASSLECMANGARTSFTCAAGVTLGAALARDRAALPAEFADVAWCDKWEARLEAAARTWQRPHAQDNLMDIVPLGKVRSNFNFSLEDKRVLNFANVVNDDDNIKQDMSIDVYGRKDKADKAKKEAEVKAAAAAAAEEKKREEEDELDALLAG